MLNQKRALITGAASGIGRAVALRFAAESALVALVDRDADGLEAVASRIRSAGGEVLPLVTDVSQASEVGAAVNEMATAWGGIDVLVGVAGIELYNRGDAAVHELPLEVWEETLAVNLTGMFLTCKYGIRLMLDSGPGSVIVTGSPTANRGIGGDQIAYSASKAGCHGLVRALAAQYADAGIRVNGVIPGFIDTPLNSDLMSDPEALSGLLDRIPLRRPGTPESVANIYAWLASDESSYATGAFFTVDGGLTTV